MNAEAQEKFHAELDSVLQGRTPTVADLAQLKYTEQIVKEAMRLYPPAFGVGRQAIADCEIGGFKIRAGAQVFAWQWVTQRDPRYFERPNDFIPERWREELAGKLPKYAYFPFGGGPRACIGNTFAMMEIILVMATIGQRFRLPLVEGHEVGIMPAMSLRPKNGVRVTVTLR